MVMMKGFTMLKTINYLRILNKNFKYKVISSPLYYLKLQTIFLQIKKRNNIIMQVVSEIIKYRMKNDLNEIFTTIKNFFEYIYIFLIFSIIFLGRPFTGIIFFGFRLGEDFSSVLVNLIFWNCI